MILYDSQRNFQRERELMGMLARRNVRNIIVDSVCCQKNESIYIEELKEKMIRRNGANIVMVEREVHDESVHSIFVDNYEASYLITRHLIDMGRRHIAHISGAEQDVYKRQGRKASLVERERSCGCSICCSTGSG